MKKQIVKLTMGTMLLNIDDSPSDMYLLNKENELAIEGEGYFDTNASYPIGIRNEVAGKISFNIDSLENFDESQNVYIFDKETNTYNSIKNTMYEVELPEGTFNDRFVLHFSSMTSKTLGTTDFNLKNGIKVIVNNGVTVQSDTVLIKTILVYDLLGRKIDSYKKVNAATQLLNQLNKTNSGLILKITLDNDEVISKKIIY
ncbi:hypothetical protein [Flavobacterium sp. WC2416]|uniref:T9SS sorting signal type C domain-containing protein n=1 Tax=Flavobacterium sp. WC2416 TaxID=3234141 RepID=A0AB39WFJ8_9FLAO